MLANLVCVLASLNNPPACIPSDTYSVPTPQRVCDTAGATAVTVDTTTGEFTSMTFGSTLADGVYLCDSVAVERGVIVAVNGSGNTVAACQARITVSHGAATIECKKSRCRSHCAVYTDREASGRTSVSCGCNLTPK